MMACRNAGCGLFEDDVEVEHVGVELDEAIEVGGQHGDVVDTGEQVHGGSLQGVIVVSKTSMAVVTAVGGLCAVEVPEVAERPPHGGAAEDLHDGGDVACRVVVQVGTGVGDDGQCRGATVARWRRGGPGDLPVMTAVRRSTGATLSNPGNTCCTMAVISAGVVGQLAVEADPLVDVGEQRVDQRLTVREVAIHGALGHLGGGGDLGEGDVLAGSDQVADGVEDPFPQTAGSAPHGSTPWAWQ